MHQRESNDVSTLQSCRILPGHLVPTIAGPNLSLPSLFNLAAAPPSVASVLILASTVPRNSLPALSLVRSLSSLLSLSLQLEKFPTAKRRRRRGGFYLHYTLGGGGGDCAAAAEDFQIWSPS